MFTVRRARGAQVVLYAVKTNSLHCIPATSPVFWIAAAVGVDMRVASPCTAELEPVHEPLNHRLQSAASLEIYLASRDPSASRAPRHGIFGRQSLARMQWTDADVLPGSGENQD